MPSLHPADWAVLVAYFALIIGVGLWKSRGSGSDDYYLAGRKLHWFVIGNALFAANISSEQFVGQAGQAYATGLLVGNWQWIGAITLALFAVIFVPVYFRARLHTIPEYLERRFSPGCRTFISVVNLAVLAFVKVALTLHAGGTIVAALAGPEWYERGIWILGLTAGAYTLVGGLKAAVVTETIQSALLITSGALTAALGLHAVGGWEALVAKVNDPAAFSLIRPADDLQYPWPAFFLGGTLLSFYYWGMDMEIAQRFLGARDARHGRLGAVYAGFLKLLALFIVVLPGLIARIYLREKNVEVPHMDQAYPTMIRTLLPTGLAGLCLAGLAAASMSTIDSALCAISSLFAFDVWKKARPKSTDRQLVAVGRVAVAAGLAIGIFWAPSIRTFGGGMFLYLINAMTFVTPGIIVCFLAGVFWRGARTSGAWASLLVGVPLGVALFVVKVRTDALLFGVADLYVSLGLIGISSLAMIIASLAARAPAAPRDEALFFSASGMLSGEEAIPRWRRSSTWLVLLAAAIVALYVAFR